MEYMMVLADAQQTKVIIILVIFMLFTFSLPMIVTKLTRPKVAKEKAKLNKRCTELTTGNIIEMHSTLPDELRDLHVKRTGSARTIASYEFSVNGVRYTGRDYVYVLPGKSTIGVFYDPYDPNNNCTSWGRKTNNGTEYIIPLLIVIGIFGFIFLCIIGIAACSGSRFR